MSKPVSFEQFQTAVKKMLLESRDQKSVDRIMEAEGGFSEDYSDYSDDWKAEWRIKSFPDGDEYLRHVLSGISAYVSMEYGL